MNPIAKILLIVSLHFTLISPALAQENSYLYQIGVKNTLHSDVLKEDREFWVQVPEDARPYEKFPVVYVLDGGEHFSALATVHHYYWGSYIPRMILVGISNRSNRTRDLTTSKVEMGQVETGGAEKFQRFIEEELISYIDGQYPTTPYRTLIGHSYAGLFTINALINHQDAFTNYIAIDPSMDWDNQKLLKGAITKLQNKNLTGKSLFISMASPLDRSNENATIEEVMQDDTENTIISRSTLSLIQTAEKMDQLNFNWKYYPNDIHGSVPLPSIIDGLRFAFEWYQLKDASKYNDPETPFEELETLIIQRKQTLSQHFGYPAPAGDEEMLNMGAYMFMQMGQMDKAKLFFQLNVEGYPDSPNTHDSLADYYLSVDDKPKAIEQLSIAYKLSGNEIFKDRIREIEEN